MASTAVIDGKCHFQMATAAKSAAQNVFHGKVCGRFLFNIKNIRMATAAFKPAYMFFMGKDSRSDSCPRSLQIQILLKRDVSGFRFQVALGGNQPRIQRFNPVDPVAERGVRHALCEFRKFFRAIADIPAVTFVAITVQFERSFAVMARTAIFPFPVVDFTYPGCVRFHIKIKFRMADTAGEFRPVFPV